MNEIIKANPICDMGGGGGAGEACKLPPLITFFLGRTLPVLKLFSTCLIHKYNSSTLTTRVHVQNCSTANQLERPAGGGRVMEVK